MIKLTITELYTEYLMDSFSVAINLLRRETQILNTDFISRNVTVFYRKS
jgi:hypothetical protein